MKKVKIEIEGMTCVNCEKHVKEKLKEIGARDVSVSSVNSLANMSVDDNIKKEQLTKAVEEAGYKATKVELK